MTPPSAPLIVNGWSLYAHPVFLDQLEVLIAEVASKKDQFPDLWRKKNCTKRLAAIFKLMTQVIPADPANPTFRLGDSLGRQHKHWFRAKFFQQYRLFFRFDSTAKVIVLAWVNDEATLRAYGSKSDAYATFQAMLAKGAPPDDYDSLLKEAKNAAGPFQSGLGKGSSLTTDP